MTHHFLILQPDAAQAQVAGLLPSLELAVAEAQVQKVEEWKA